MRLRYFDLADALETFSLKPCTSLHSLIHISDNFVSFILISLRKLGEQIGVDIVGRCGDYNDGDLPPDHEYRSFLSRPRVQVLFIPTMSTGPLYPDQEYRSSLSRP